MTRRINPPLIAARTFEAAARHCSFQRAAAELNVTPTAVSHQVKRLEEFLGLTLFVRKNRAVQPTTAGHILAAQLGELLMALEHALDPTALGEAQPLRITAMPSLAAKWLAHRMAGFQALHPGIPVELSDDDEVVDFAAGRFAMALRYGDGNHAGVAVHPWMDAPVMAVCSPEFYASKRARLRRPADVLQHTLIHDSTIALPGKPPGWVEWLDASGLSMPDQHPALRFSSVYIALEAARAGRGLALAPEPLVRDDVRRGVLVMPFDLVLENPYAFWIVHPHHLERDHRVRAMRRWLRDCAEY